MGPSLSAPRIPRQLHDRPVDFLVEGRAAGGELAERVMLLAHQVRAESESLADAALVQLAALQGVAREVGVSQSAAADAEKADAAVPNIAGAGVDRVLLQPAIAGADHGQPGERALQCAG